jgi:NADH:ubiquinone oxidoreductase subunit D
VVTKLKSELLETEHKETKDLILNLGPSHPSMHGIIHNIVELEDETIKKATPVVGYLHRAFEKLAEQEHYQQFNVPCIAATKFSALCGVVAYSSLAVALTATGNLVDGR